ncbi:MAG: TIGR02302 family protein [Rhizobiaceae bacterium]
MTQTTNHVASTPSLTKVRLLTGLSMFVERLWPLLLPSLIVAATFVSLSWFGLFRAIPDGSRYIMASILAVSFLISLWPLRKFRIPANHEVTARLELSNDLAHQPISVQTDALAGQTDDFSKALWQTHQKRMADKLAAVRADSPKPQTHELDKWALRTLPALTLFIAFAFSTGSLGGRVSDVWNGKAAIPAIPPRIDAWVTPPRYTAKAPVFLNTAEIAGTGVTVPEGSILTVRIGAEASQTYRLTVNGQPLPDPEKKPDGEPVSTAGQLLTTKLTSDATVELGVESGPVSQWAFKVIKDKPPEVTFTADPSKARNGTVTLSYSIKDDYGAAKGVAQFQLKPLAKDARPLYTMPDLALALPRRNATANTAKTAKDLTQHPLAGEEYEIVLQAEDGAGHIATSAPKTFVLPEYNLASGLSRALAEDRRLLARDANAKPLVLELLDALTIRPEETINNASHYLGIETARIRLYQAKTDDELREVVDYLWQVALNIDKNSLSDAERRLQQAQDKLAEALENGASDEEIQKLMQELRQAMNEFMKQLAEEERRNPSNQKQDPNSQELSSADLEKMLDKLEDLAKQGAKDQAKELLNQLRDMMNNLQAKRDNKGGQGGEGQSEMQGKLNELGKMLRDQQKLLDDTFKQDREQQTGEGEGQEQEQGAGQEGEGEQGQGQQGQNGQGGQPNGNQEGPNGGLGGLQQRQNKLGEQLQGLMDGLKGLGIEPGTELGDAGEAMGRAGRNLGEGDAGEATGDQTEALNALRKGAEGLMNQMQQAMGDQGGGQQRGEKGPSNRDPLGRARSDNGPDLGEGTKVPDEIDVQRAREILEAIRKRLGNALSPELEKQYLERLLKFD